MQLILSSDNQYSLDEESYLKKMSDILNLYIPQKFKVFWTKEQNNIDNMKKLLPKTKIISNWEPLLIMSKYIKKQKSLTINLKGALLNKKTNKLLLLSSTTDNESITDPIDTHSGRWYTSNKPMTASHDWWYSLHEEVIKYNWLC